LLLGQVERRPNGQQFSADAADFRIYLAGFNQRRDEVRKEQDVGIECQNPLAAREPDGLVLGRGETDVFVVEVDAALILKLFQDVNRSVSGGVIDDDDLKVRVLLFEYRFKTALDESAAVICDQRDGD